MSQNHRLVKRYLKPSQGRTPSRLRQRPPYHHILVLAFITAVVLAQCLPAAAQPAPPTSTSVVNPTLTKHPKNRRYFMLDNPCEAIYLAGTGHSNNIQDFLPATFNFENEYPPGNERGASNFIRGWHWEGSTYGSSSIWPLAFKRTGPGNAHDGQLRFDLTRYADLNYVGRLEDRASGASGKEMYLSVMLFQGWSVDNVGGVHPWPDHPFYSGNNINNVNGDWDETLLPNGKHVFPYGRELHRLTNKPIPVAQHQDNYVKHIVEMLNSYENILWEVSNESYTGSLPWQQHIAKVIRDKEALLTKRHLVWISAPRIDSSSMDPSSTGVTNKDVYNSTADVISPTWQRPAVRADGTEVSGGSSKPGDIYQSNPPATSGRKIVILDTDHIGAPCDWCSREWVWKAFTRGYHVALHEVNPGENTLHFNQKADVRQAIKQTLAYSRKISLIDMAPQNEAQATPYCSSGYCLYTSDNPDPQADANNNTFVQAIANGKQYLVFKPATTNQVTIFNLPPGDYSGEWKDVSDNTDSVSAVATFHHAGGPRTLTPPLPWGSTAAVLFLKRHGITFICS